MSRLQRIRTTLVARRVPLLALHALGLTAAIVLAILVSRRYDLPAFLVSPVPSLHPVWLPGLVVVAYLLGWFAYGFLRATTDDPPTADAAVQAHWRAVVEELAAEKIDLARTPLVLVLGQPAGGITDYFSTVGHDILPRGPAQNPTALSVFASRQAVFVAVNAGALARHLLLAADAVDAPQAARAPALDLLDAVDHAAEPGPTSDATADLAAGWLPTPPSDDDARHDAAAAELIPVLELVARSRQPFCPANGLIWLVPVNATRDAAMTTRLTQALLADQTAARAAWGLHLPQSLVVVNCEDVPGFLDLVELVPEDDRATRLLGVTFPSAGAQDEAEMLGRIDTGVTWLMRNLVGGLACHRLSRPQQGAVAGWRAFAELTARRSAIAKVAGVCALSTAPGGQRLAAVSLAATGSQPTRRAFLAAPLHHAVGLENAVAWTDAAKRADRRAHTLATIVWALTALGLAWLVVWAVGLTR